MSEPINPSPILPLDSIRGTSSFPGRAAVLGAGAWGTALASALQRAGISTTLWARRREAADAINSQRCNPRYLPGIELAAGLRADSDLARALRGAQLVIAAVPSASMREVARLAAPHLAEGTAFVSASKGIEVQTGALMSRVLDEELGPHALIGALGGPSFAAEVASGEPTLLTLAMPALQRLQSGYLQARRLADALADRLAPAGVMLEPTWDAVGTQIGGVLKNMVAIACGMAAAAGLGENARAGIITHGLADMRRLTRAMGGRVDTLLGCSGIGDLFLTAASAHSRNTRLGMRLGETGGALGDPKGELAEGALSVFSVEVLEQRYGLRLAVAAAVRDVLEARATPELALRRLLREVSASGRPSVIHLPRTAQSIVPAPGMVAPVFAAQGSARA